MSDSFPSSIHRQLAFVPGAHGSQVYFGAADGAPDIIATITEAPAAADPTAPLTQWCIRVTYPGFVPPRARPRSCSGGRPPSARSGSSPRCCTLTTVGWRLGGELLLQHLRDGLPLVLYLRG